MLVGNATLGRYHVGRFEGKTGTFALVYDLPTASAFQAADAVGYSRLRIFGNDLYVAGFANDSLDVDDRGLIVKVSNLLLP